MVYYSEDYLCHHGIKGQKWGVRRYQNPDGSLTMEGIVRYGYKNAKKAKYANLDKFGKSKDTNVLYITGYSGSGKSTTASSIYRKGDSIIRLDAYSEPDDTNTILDKEFTSYLNKKVPNWREMKEANSTSKIKRHSKEYWDIVDSFDKAIDSFAARKFDKKERVIVEGVQIADNWLKGDGNDYKGKPIIVLQTNPIKSMKQAFERDDRGNLLKGLTGLDNAKEYIQWYYNTNKNLKDLILKTDSKKDVDSLISLYSKEVINS